MRAPLVIVTLYALCVAPMVAEAQPAQADRAPSEQGASPPIEAPRAALVIESSAQRSQRQPLVSVRIEPSLPGEDPWSRVAMIRGAPVDDDDLRAAVERAVASGTFADVRATARDVAGGLELWLRGERRRRMLELRIEGIDQRSIEAVRADFAIASLSWVTQRQVDEACGRVVEGYRMAGYRTAVARAALESTTDPDYVRVRVQVTEGRPTRLASVRLFAPEIDREFGPTLCDALAEWPTTVAMGEAACRPLVGRGDPVDARVVRAATEQMTSALRRLGHYSARLDEPALVPMRSSPQEDPRVELRFTGSIGPSYSIVFEGARAASAAELREALRLEDERAIEDGTLSTLVARLREWYARRAFSEVRISARIDRASRSAHRLVFIIDERRPVYVRTVAFSGARAMSYQALRDLLDEHLRAELPGGSILAAPTDAQATAIDDVRNSEARGARMPLPLQPERTFVAEVYQEAARRMVARYRELGYLDATVELDGAPHRDVDEVGRPVLDVNFRIDERAQVRLIAVAFEGNTAVASATLAERARVDLGGPLSMTDIASARDRIAEHYRESGYNYVRVGSVIDRSPDGANARVRFVLTEGPLVRVTRVDVRGLRAIGRRLVYDRLALRENDVFRPSLARESQRRLGELGYFSAVTVTLAEPDVESAVKTLIVQVSEAGGSLEIRGGASAWELLRGSVQWTRRNVLNSSVSMTASLQAGVVAPIAAFADATLFPSLSGLQWYERLRGRAALSVQAPPVRALGADFRPAADVSLSRSVDLQFAINGVDVSASTLVRPARWVTITPVLNFQINDLQLFNVANIEDVIRMANPAEQLRLGRLLLLPQGTTFLTSARLTVAIDQRDQVFNPQSGFFLSVTGEFVGVLGFIERATTMTTMTPPPGNTLRGTLSFSGYVSPSVGVLGTWTIASNFRIGVNGTFDPCNRVTYPNRQFFLGGADSLRGWLQDSLIPVDVLSPVPNTSCPNLPPPQTDTSTLLLSQRSGDAFVLWRNELRVPIGASGFGLDFFIDVGNLWKDLRNVFSIWNSFTLRAAVGAGVRYITPIGPVGLDFGFPLVRTQIGVNSEPLVVVSFSFSSA